MTARGSDVAVSGITASSGNVRPGDLFAALPGARAHGATFVPAALAAGAVAVLTDENGAGSVPEGISVLVAGDPRAVLGDIASAVYARPSEALRMIGVTGTSGKTTTTFFLRDALRDAGRSTGLIGTVATYIGGEEMKTGFTTPEAPELHALLAVMKERGVTDVAMEVSSHALELGRVGGVGFEIGAFTNLSQDHLDFHPDMQSYFAAKAKLFAPGVAPVIVVDDEWGARLVDIVDAPTTVSMDARAGVTWWASEIAEQVDGTTTFLANTTGHPPIPAGTAIPGRFNVTNALLAIAICARAGLEPAAAAAAIMRSSVPGRMERVSAGQPFLALVDYSHKPAAVEGALAALRRLTSGRLIVVLGCGGDRDHAKRPLMGAIAARDADVFIATDDNPRSEDPAAIRREMLAGVQTIEASLRADVREIGDRAEAIAAAVAMAEAGDTVLIAGKGHETGQEIDGVVHPFDDRLVLRAALEEHP